MKRLLQLLTAVSVCLATYASWRMLGRPTMGIDDAAIFFVYARNIVHGDGAVYTVGAGHVEGFSSVLYMLLCTAAFAFSHTPQVVLFIANLLFAVLTSLAVVSVLDAVVDHFALGDGVRFLFAVTYLAWMLVNPMYFVWAVVTLMDTGVWSLVLTASFALLVRLALRQREPSMRESLASGALIALTILARPEGELWAMLLWLAFSAVAVEYRSSMRRAVRMSAVPFAAMAVTSIGLLMFRLRYFGYPLPNTYYAKVSAARLVTLGDGRHYLHVFVSFYGLMVVLNILLALGIACRALQQRRRRDPIFGLCAISALFGLTALLVPVLEGGDHFSGFRMYQPLMPVLFFPSLAWFFLPIKRVGARPVLFVVAALLLMARPLLHSWSDFDRSNQSTAANPNKQLSIWDGFYIERLEQENGERMRLLFPGGTVTQGVGAAGGFALGYDGQTYDLLGLNDVRMAHADRIKVGPKDHQSFNKDVFYRIAPQMMLAWTDPGNKPIDPALTYKDYLDAKNWDNQIFKGIFDEPRFQQDYIYAVITDDRHPDIPCMSFFRRDFLTKLLHTPHVHLNWASSPFPPQA